MKLRRDRTPEPPINFCVVDRVNRWTVFMHLSLDLVLKSRQEADKDKRELWRYTVVQQVALAVDKEYGLKFRKAPIDFGDLAFVWLG